MFACISYSNSIKATCIPSSKSKGLEGAAHRDSSSREDTANIGGRTIIYQTAGIREEAVAWLIAKLILMELDLIKNQGVACRCKVYIVTEMHMTG